MDIKAVIFDFGGVFTTSPVSKFYDYEKEHNLPEKFIGGVIKTNINTNAWAQYERSEIGLEEFDSLFAEESKAAGHEIPGRVIVGMLSLTFRPDMIEALSKVKIAGFKTGCITNNLPKKDSKQMVAPQEERSIADAIYDNFDHLIESSKVGIRKPEPRIYEMMCEMLGEPAEACVFLDDLGVNLKPAMAMGMKTIKVPLGDVRPAIEELAGYTGLAL